MHPRSGLGWPVRELREARFPVHSHSFLSTGTKMRAQGCAMLRASAAPRTPFLLPPGLCWDPTFLRVGAHMPSPGPGSRLLPQPPARARGGGGGVGQACVLTALGRSKLQFVTVANASHFSKHCGAVPAAWSRRYLVSSYCVPRAAADRRWTSVIQTDQLRPRKCLCADSDTRTSKAQATRVKRVSVVAGGSVQGWRRGGGGAGRPPGAWEDLGGPALRPTRGDASPMHFLSRKAGYPDFLKKVSSVSESEKA